MTNEDTAFAKLVLNKVNGLAVRSNVVIIASPFSNLHM